MKIAYVSQEFPPSLRAGGIASYVKEIAYGMVARGHQVTVLTANDDTRRESETTEDGVRVIRLAGGNFYLPQVEGASVLGRLKKLRTLYRFGSYRRILRNAVQRYGSFDIIEVAEFGGEGLYLNELGIPIVYRLHTPTLMDHNKFSILPLSVGNMPYYLQGMAELRLLRDKAKFVTSCSTSLKEWTEQNVLTRPIDIRVIYNPIHFRDYSAHQSGKREDDALKILFAGTICDWKGAGDLVQACEILAGKGVNVTLSMVGKAGSYADTLPTYPWLNILGKVNRESLLLLYKQADVVCFPSWWENMPMVCIEAMMCGALVIGSNSGGMAEIITDGVNGFLLPPKSPELWAAKILEVAALPTATKLRISAAAVQRIRCGFGLEVIAAQMEAYYNEVIKGYLK